MRKVPLSLHTNSKVISINLEYMAKQGFRIAKEIKDEIINKREDSIYNLIHTKNLMNNYRSANRQFDLKQVLVIYIKPSTYFK